MDKKFVFLVSSLFKIITVFSTSLAVAVAFRFLRYPTGRSKLRQNERAILASAVHKTLRNNAVDVHTYQWGDGRRPVLLIHGWESRGSRFSPLVRQLVLDGFSPITFDLPGHGDSGGKTTTIIECKDICLELSKRFGEFEAVIAHSIGVLCAFYVIKNSVKSKRIVAIGGVAEFRYLIEKFCRTFKVPASVKLGLTRRVEGLFTPIDNIWERFSVDYAAEQLTQPVLVVHDHDDEIVNFDQGEKIAASFNNQAQVLYTRGLGHKRVLADVQVVETVGQFLRST